MQYLFHLASYVWHWVCVLFLRIMFTTVLVCWVTSVCYLGVRFGIGFVCLLVGGYVITYISFNSRNGVSVGLFY